MPERAPQRQRNPVEIERVHEQASVPDLAHRAGPHEAAQLLVERSISLSGLCLEAAKRTQLTLRLEHRLDPRATHGTNQLILEISDAHEEAELFDRWTGQASTEPGPLQSVDDVTFLGVVVETGDPYVTVGRVEPGQHAREVGHPSGRHHDESISRQIPARSLGKGLHGRGIAGPLDQHHPAHVFIRHVELPATPTARDATATATGCGSIGPRRGPTTSSPRSPDSGRCPTRRSANPPAVLLDHRPHRRGPAVGSRCPNPGLTTLPPYTPTTHAALDPINEPERPNHPLHE